MLPTLIHQPAPCAESWDAMTPTEVGRHCASCQTQVVDFTRMTDGQVVAFLSQYRPERRCGRFREDQVDRSLLAAAQPVTGWRRWAVTTVLLLGSVADIKARAQGAKPGHNARAMAPAATTPMSSAISDSMFLVQGVIRNWWGIRKEGARVTVTGIKTGPSIWATSDAQGYFQLLLPKRKRGAYLHLSVRYWKRHETYFSLVAWVPFDSARTQPYRITLKKRPVSQHIGFF